MVPVLTIFEAKNKFKTVKKRQISETDVPLYMAKAGCVQHIPHSDSLLLTIRNLERMSGKRGLKAVLGT